MNLALAFDPAPLAGLEPTDEAQLDDEDLDEDLDEDDAGELRDGGGGGPRLLGPVRLHIVESELEAKPPQPQRLDELILQQLASGAKTEEALLELAPASVLARLRKRGAIRPLDATSGGARRWRLAAPTKGYMVPTASTRRDDCTRYAECLYVAAKRNGEWGCPRDCEHFVPVSRDQRIAEATIERVSRMGAP